MNIIFWNAVRSVLIAIGIVSLVIALMTSAMAAEHLALRASIDHATLPFQAARTWNPSYATGRADFPTELVAPNPWTLLSARKREGVTPLVMLVSLDSDVYPVDGPPVSRTPRVGPPVPTEAPPVVGSSRQTPWDDWENQETNWSDLGYGGSPWD